MTSKIDDLGLDLAAIKEAHGSHSIFAPSGSVIWLNTPGCLIPNILAPDSAGYDAAYGTVGHECGEQWLKAIPDICWGMGQLAANQIDEAEPRHRLGEIVIVKERDTEFEIEIDQEMLDYVRLYVEACIGLPGKHFVETRVDFSDLTPIDDQGGTCDHAACEPGVLTITDLKMGMIRVLAALNTQLMLYAYGFFRAYDHLYHFERIVIRIWQPRLEHFDRWECSRADLLAYAEFVRGQAKAAWQLNGARRPGWWCKKGFCNVIGTCPAYISWFADMAEQAADESFDDMTADYPECVICEGLGCDVCMDTPANRINDDGSIEGVYTVKDMAVATEAFVSGKLDLRPKYKPASMSTEALAKLLPMRSTIERFFNELERELESRAVDGEDVEVYGFKLVDSRAGRRAWRDKTEAIFALEDMVKKIDFDVSRFTPPTLLSPAQIEELIRKPLGITKKEAEALLDSLVSRPPRRQTLAEVSDMRPKRPPLEDDVFPFEDNGGL